MKKILVLILGIVMIFSIVACTPNAGPSASPSASGEVSATPAATPVATDAKVLLDTRVRQALSLAIDRNYINEQVFNGIHEPAYGFVPANIPGAADGTDYRAEVAGPMSSDLQANIAKAKQLLADAGFPNGEGFPKLAYTYNTNTTHQGVAEAVQKMWKDNLGIVIDLSPMEWGVFQGFRKTDECQIARQGWTGDYVDVATFLDIFITGAGTNDSHYSSAEYDQLVNDARSERDPVKRMQMYHQAEDILINQDAGVIPIVYQKDEALVHTDFTGYSTTPTGNRIFFNASKPEFVANVGEEPETLDPNMNQSVDGYIYTTQLYEGIYRYNADGTLSLGQAASCDYDATTNTINIVLRDGIKWSDGKPVTAQDFVYSWKRMMDPNTGSPYSYVYPEMFKNGNEVLAKTVPADQLSVTATDDKHITIECGKLPGYYKDLLAFPESMPLREDIVSKDATGWQNTVNVYNGRFKLTTFAHEDKLIMEKNDQYWDTATTKVNKITFILSNDDASLYAAFQKGEIDFEDIVPVDERASLIGTPEYQLFPSLSIYYIQMNNAETVK